MTTYIPRRESLTGSDFSGSDGDANRTYTLNYSGAISEYFTINLSGSILQPSEYTLSSGVVTISQNVWDDSEITIDYYTPSSSASSGTTEYASTLELVKFMNLLGDTVDNSADTFLETVGTGTGSQSKFMLDHKGIIANSYTFYYGANAEAALSNELTENTHFALDKDTGVLTLTIAGMTAVSTNKIYADYKYNIEGLPESQLQAALDKAGSWVDSYTNNHFADGTSDTPNWGQVLLEKQDGKGVFERDYYAIHYPLPDVSTQLNGAITSGDATITVDSTAGFPSTGVLGIAGIKVSYTGKTSTTFTGCSGTSDDVDDDTKVYPYAIEASNTDSGTTTSWTVLQEGSQYDIDLDTGRIHVYIDNIDLAATSTQIAPRSVPNRFRANYIYGVSEIPSDVKKATLMIASHEMMKGAVRSATTRGLDNFQPRYVDADVEEIKEILNHFVSVKVSNV